MWPLSTFLTLLSILKLQLAYNLDAKNAVIFEDPVDRSRGENNRASYFGYSIALYVNGNDSLLLVGAPRANSSRINDRREGIIEAGAVYTCPFLRMNYNDTYHSSCSEWQIDGSIFGQQSLHVNTRKDYAWLGGTIVVENSTIPRVAICAPRWTQVLDNPFLHIGYSKKWYMNGMCYMTTINGTKSFYQLKSNTVKKYFPLSNENDQVISRDGGKTYLYYHGMGQAGFSLHFNHETRDLVLGAPGFYYWTGAGILIDKKDQRYSLRALKPNIVDDQRLEYNAYFGYSMTSGHFYKATERLYASGAPRSADTLGEVFIFSFPKLSKDKIIIRRIIKGEQYGEYFGSTLASCDVNNDGRDDLIVGAPHWSKDIEEGRIYAFISEVRSDFKTQRIEGNKERGRFGHAISCIGDLDFDGYGDVAVGAPYEDDFRGAVYIYNGEADGLTEKFSQRIQAADLSTHLRGFGASISEPRDLDGNGYLDIAVGAYLSGHAVVLKARPVVILNVDLIRAENFTLMENSTYFIVDVCKDYNGAFIPQTLEMALALTIDESHKRAIIYQNGRLFGNVYRVSTILRKGERKCNPVKINLKRNIQNVIDPIDIVANVSFIENFPCTNCPVINRKLSKTSDNLKLAYILDCGTDEVCISDLYVDITSNTGHNYTIGSKSNINITIFIDNLKEPAYKTQAHIYLPAPIALGRIPLQCDGQIIFNETLEVICNVGNPLRHNCTIVVELDMSLIHYSDKFKEIKVAVTTQSEENNITNNSALYNISCSVDADISIFGKADEDLYSYFEEATYEEKIFTFNHVYELWKLGVTPIDEVALIFRLPMYWKGMEIVKIHRKWNSMNERQYYCEKFVSDQPNRTIPEIYQNFMNNENNKSEVITPDERTIYFNCTNEDMTCQTFLCKLGPFADAQSIATFTLTVDFNFSNIVRKEMAKRDVILFVTEAIVVITKPNLTIISTDEKSHFKQIATTLLLHYEPDQVEMWIIVLSVILGMLMLLFITSFLFKLGFFNRQTREDLDALRTTEPVDAFG